MRTQPGDRLGKARLLLFFNSFLYSPALSLSVAKMTKTTQTKTRGQAAVEYILLVALGLFVLVIAFALANYVKNFADATLLEVAVNRNETIAMITG